MTATSVPVYLHRECVEALPLLKRALIELKIEQGLIKIIEDTPQPAQGVRA